MNIITLARKVEKALTSYMSTAIPSGLNIYAGHDKASAATLPFLIVYAEDSQPHPDMPSHTGVRIVSVRFEIRVDSEVAGARTSLDTWRKTVEDTLGSVPDILTALNPFTPDTRAVTDLFIYDILDVNQPTEMDRADWIEQVVIGVVAQPLDSNSP